MTKKDGTISTILAGIALLSASAYLYNKLKDMDVEEIKEEGLKKEGNIIYLKTSDIE